MLLYRWAAATFEGDAVEIGEDFEIVEPPVLSGSELVGETIAESDIREQTGANVIGAWFRGEFASPPSLGARLDEQTILLVAGHDRQLGPLKQMTLSEQRRRRRGHVIICGHGEVGSTVGERVVAEGVSCATVEKKAHEGVDIVGDVIKKDVLREAGAEDASTVILARASDTMTVFATLVVRELNPESRLSRAPARRRAFANSTRPVPTTDSRWRPSVAGCSPRRYSRRTSSPTTSRSRSSDSTRVHSPARRWPGRTSAPKLAVP